MQTIRTLLTLALVMVPVTSAFAGSADKHLDIYWVDTEGGAATLIVTPAGESVLIDTGNPGDRDPGRIHHVAAEVAGLKKIDHLITTHNHIDHFGGAAELSKLIPIGEVHDNGKFKGGFERPDEAYLNFKADKRTVLNPGDVLKLAAAAGSPEVSLTCVAARQQVMPAPEPKTAADARERENVLCEKAKRKREDYSDNANSIVNVLSFGAFRFFDGGDVTWNTEIKLICPANLVGSVDVYQVSHHGLNVSNNPVLINSIAPTVAVMGNGPTKGGDPEVMETLKATPSIKAVFQLHRNLKPKEDDANCEADHIANAEATDACKGNFVKLSVDPDAKKYTISIPATKFQQTFDVKK